MSNKEQIISLLERAYAEGAASASPSAADGGGAHNVTNYAAREFLKSVSPAGYAKGDASLLVPYLFMIQEREEPSWTESTNPYIVQGDGDTVSLIDGNKTIDYKPYRGTFRLIDLVPDKTYKWVMKKSGKTIKSGMFDTIGEVRMIGFEAIDNFRDLYVPGYIKPGIVFRSANPDSVKVNSDDHKMLKRLGINTQISLRTTSEAKPRTDLFKNTYAYGISDYANILNNTTNIKAAITALADNLEKGNIVLINCKQGADRTGTFCYIVQALCSVPAGILQAHWELTSLSRLCNFKLWNYERSSFACGELRTFVQELVKLYGSDPYTQVYSYLTKKCGVSASVIEKIQKRLMK